MEDERSILIWENDESHTVAHDERTGIEAHGDNVPTALYTLCEKLEMELLR